MLLIISPTEKHGAAISEIFHFMGIVNRAITPSKAFSEVSGIYRAVLIINPEKFPDAYEFVRVIRRLSLGSSVFALTENASYSDTFDYIFKENTFSSALYSKMNEFIKTRGAVPLGEYRLAGIDASVELDGVYYFGKQIKLTKTETMILRYLICAYPAHSDARDILLYSFRQGRLPEPSNVRTHISSINKKFRARFGKSIIASQEKAGYTILTPERESNLLLV